MIIRITQKLQNEIGIRAAGLMRAQESDMPFTEWYAHLFLLNRKKQIIFVEKHTLFSFCLENISRKDIRECLPVFFKKGLGKAIYSEGASGEVVSKIMSLCSGKFILSKTENRRTIGAMNEFVKQHKFSSYYQDRPIDMQDKYNRHMPMRGFPNGSKKYEFPIDVFSATLKDKYGLIFVPHKIEYSDSIFSNSSVEGF